MSITFLITTYNRQESCQRLVDSLQGLGRIVVVGDGCTYKIDRCEYYNQIVHRGKAGYWLTVNILFSYRGKSDYYIMLPDDFLPAKDMIPIATYLWRVIDNPQKVCLNLYTDRIGLTCWNNISPVDMGAVYKTGWVDMCFFCDESFFRSIGTIPEPNINRINKPNISSGVGRYISLKLSKNLLSLYQVKESLVIPQEEHNISQMKPI